MLSVSAPPRRSADFIWLSMPVESQLLYQVALVVRVVPASWKRNGVSVPLPPVSPA